MPCLEEFRSYYTADYDTYSRKRGFGVSKKVYEYAEIATNPDQLIEKIVEKFKYQPAPFEGEPYHIAEHKTCKISSSIEGINLAMISNRPTLLMVSNASSMA